MTPTQSRPDFKPRTESTAAPGMRYTPPVTPLRRGRPPKAAGDRKEVTVRFRVTAEQREAMNQAAIRAGMSTSEWLRRLALEAAARNP